MSDKLKAENKMLVAQNAAMLAEYQRLTKQMHHDEETFSRRIRWLEDWKRKDAKKIEELQSAIDGPEKAITRAISLIDEALDHADKLMHKRNELAKLIGIEEVYPGYED